MKLKSFGGWKRFEKYTHMQKLWAPIILLPRDPCSCMCLKYMWIYCFQPTLKKSVFCPVLKVETTLELCMVSGD